MSQTGSQTGIPGKHKEFQTQYKVLWVVNKSLSSFVWSAIPDYFTCKRCVYLLTAVFLDNYVFYGWNMFSFVSLD